MLILEKILGRTRNGDPIHTTQQLGGRIGENNAFGFLKGKSLNFKPPVLDNKTINV